jgi:hypothetical protein
VSIRIKAKTMTPATAKIRFIEAPFCSQLDEALFGIQLDISYDF